MSQTTILPGGQTIGFAGMIADSYPNPDITSGFNMDTQQIPFGFGLMHQPGAADERAYVLPTGPTGSVVIDGLSVFDMCHSRGGSVDSYGNYSGDMGASGLLPKAGLQVGRKGRFLVPVESAVVVDDRPFCRIVPTGALSQGSWGGTGIAGFMKDCTNQGVFRSATYTAADGVTKVAILECNFTAKP